MRPPGSDTLRQQYEAQQRAAGDDAAVEQETSKELQRLALAMEFEESTRAKVMHGQAAALAHASERSVHLDLLRRRDQLRSLLAAEGIEMEGELSERAARAVVDLQQAARERTAALKERAEQQRQQVVAQAREKQDRERIEPLRLAERAALTLACKEVNLGQMRDRQEQLEAAREERRLQQALHIKTIQAQMEREELEAREELARKKALCDALRQQVEYQQQRQDRQREEEHAEAVRRLDALREELHQERLREMERRRLKREELQRLFEEQIRQRERAMAEEADGHSALDEAVARSARQQIQEEKADRSKVDAAAEMKMFMAHVAALRKQQELADLEEQRIRDEHAASIQRDQDERRCRANAARKRMLQDTLEGRRRQLETAQMARAREALEAAEEAERVRRCREDNLQLAADLQRRKAEEQRRYADDLRQQISYQKLLKDRQAQEERLQLEQARQEEQQYQQRVRQLLQNPQKYSTHPFRLKIEGKALSWPE
ncbi:trichohyalin-like [Frankliniella occidentalis]|uniref:Trichohyalin-like n=1 Tax=Frankliniella occidentalis TaxID=133901 RepID=A0A9C6U5W7_FRAOC|nr:trichohyalin-like [Frankliniella occidentalis]